MTYVRDRSAAVPEVTRISWLIFRRLWQLLDNPAARSTPVFIVGSGRSGTDLLVEHLAWSLGAKVYNEAHQAAFENWRLRSPETLSRLIAETHARAVIFKPIVETHRAAELLEIFNDAKIVFIVRQYRDAIDSIARFFPDLPGELKKWEMSGLDGEHRTNASRNLRMSFESLYREDLTQLEAAALYWLVYNNLYFELRLDTNPAVLLTFYEDLVNSPTVEFSRICEFLSIPYSRRMERGIHSSSMKKPTQFDVRPELAEACEKTWERLSAEKGR